GRCCTFVLGPIQAVTRTVTEPPSHLGCAEYAVRVCPFLANPERGRFDGAADPGMFGFVENPFVQLGRTRGKLIVGDPVRVAWRTRGRAATAAEIEAS